MDRCCKVAHGQLLSLAAVGAALALLFAPPAWGEERLPPPNPSAVCTPHGWVHEALASLAAEGLIPDRLPVDFAPGYRRYTRGELVEIVERALRAALEHPAQLTQRQRDLLSLLASEFSRGLAARGLSAADLAPITEQPQDLRGTRGLSARLAASAALVGGEVSVASASSASVVLRSGHPERWALARVALPRAPLVIDDPWAGGIDELFLRVRQRSYVLTIGAERSRWGPGYYGSFAKSDAPKPRPGVRLETNIPLFGHEYTVMHEVLFAVDDSPQTTIFHRRIEGHWGDVDLGYFEISKTDAGLHPLCFVLPVQGAQYFIVRDPRYRNWGRHTNNVMGIDAYWRVAPSLHVYCVVSADEFAPQLFLQRLGLFDFFLRLTAGTDLLRGKPSRDKLGTTIGFYLPHLFGSDRTTVRFESIAAWPNYGIHPGWPVHLYDAGQPLWPGGLQDARFYALRIDRKLSTRSRLVVEGRLLAQGVSGGLARHQAGLAVRYFRQAGRNGFFSVGLGVERAGLSLTLSPQDTARLALSISAGSSF